MSGVFAQWQPVYAEHNIPTVPVKFVCDDDGKIQKVPMVGRYGKFGLPASTKIAAKFPSAPGIGFVCGRRSRITVLDVDIKDERILTDAISRHGETPIIARTASGKFHAYYRHNGERRWTRPRRDVPVDILGDGLSVAPPSEVGSGRYEFIQGSLDDLASLPPLRNLGQALSADAVATDFANMREGNGRNNALFRTLGRAAQHHCDDFDQLLDYARTLNDQFGEPMPDAEVVKVANSVWKMQCEGRNRFGQHGAWFPLDEVETFREDPDDFYLLGFLRAHNHPDSTFMVANGLAERFKWDRKRLAASRRRLIERGHFKAVRQAGDGHPALYRWERKQTGRN